MIKKQIKTKKKVKAVSPHNSEKPTVSLDKPYTIDEATEDGRRVGYASGFDAGKESGILTGAIFGAIGMFVIGIVMLYFAR